MSSQEGLWIGFGIGYDHSNERIKAKQNVFCVFNVELIYSILFSVSCQSLPMARNTCLGICFLWFEWVEFGPVS